MMPYTIKRNIFLKLLIFISAVPLVAQNTQQTIQIAQELYQAGEIQDAIEAYRRVLYFNKTMAPELYKELGECYMVSSDYKKARYFFDLGTQATSSDSLQLEFWFRSVASYILENELVYAENELLGINPDKFTWSRQKYNFYFGVLTFKQGRLEEAEKYFRPLTTDTVLLAQVFRKAHKINNKKPGLAMALSVVVPGLGQTYAGSWQEGVNSLGINALTTSLYLYVAIEYSLLDAVIAVVPWWHRYYVGGFTNAKKMVKARKQENLNKVLLFYLNNNKQISN
jgi:TM2 domain-containing membrane protein YozV